MEFLRNRYLKRTFLKYEPGEDVYGYATDNISPVFKMIRKEEGLAIIEVEITAEDLKKEFSNDIV